MRLLLASRSPQRRAILEQLGVAFEARPTDVEELAEGPPLDVALENAFRKASTLGAREPGQTVLGVDTLVALGRAIYGKPPGEPAARKTLRALGGRAHTVVSGVCVIDDAGTRSAVATTQVVFRRVEPELLDWYVATGEWRERAGGYAIQGRGAALVDRIEGDYSNVVGLPVPTLLDLLPDLLSANVS